MIECIITPFEHMVSCRIDLVLPLSYSFIRAGLKICLHASPVVSMHLFCLLIFVNFKRGKREGGVYDAWEQYLGMEYTDTAT